MVEKTDRSSGKSRSAPKKTTPDKAKPGGKSRSVRKTKTASKAKTTSKKKVRPADGRVNRCPVVGIGASAGGLDAFKQFLQSTPPNPGLAFVLIQHLDPDHESLMADLLSKYTPMPVVQAEDATPIEPNHVYMIPPNKFIKVKNGGLFLDEPVKQRGVRLPIDYFFRSLAEQRRELAIGVVLSGTGSDGTLGLKAIKAEGGMVMVQDPATAAYDGMPRSALAAGVVDFLLAIDKMPEVLTQYVKHPYLDSDDEDRPSLLEQAPDHYRSIINLLRAHTDYDFRCYKKGTLNRRIQRRMGLSHVVTLADYLDLLRKNRDEIDLLFKDLLINVTGFFRDPEAWSELEDEVIAPLVASKADNESVRIWVPGCATGEEAYSIGMLVLDQFQAQNKHLKLQIFATDLDTDAIHVAREGIYPANIAADLPPARLEKYFGDEENHRYRVNKRLREASVFAVQNLIGDPPFSQLDLISCRNLMIYLEPSIQRKMIQMFHFALAPRAYLFLGGSETIGQETRLFKTVSKKWRIYRKIGTSKRGVTNFPIVPGEASGPFLPQDTPQNSESTGVELAKRTLLERFVPATVLINRNYEVQYFHGDLKNYLDIPHGEPTTDLIAMCVNGLRSKLRAAVGMALSKKQTAIAIAPQVKRNGQSVSVRIEVELLPQRKGADPLLLITFRDESAHEGNASADSNADSRRGNKNSEADSKGRKPSKLPPAGRDEDLVKQLKNELQVTQEDLQSTIEELETSNEELKASNEEVMSMNEELQSTNEELETSREELQSLNEELSTVNTQLEEKVREVENTNDDLSNLLTSTEIATIFLDTDFCIRRFTPATSELLHVIPSDIGRPVSDLSPRFNDPDLFRDAGTVMRKLAPMEKRVCVEVVSPSTSEPGDHEETAAEADSNEFRWFIRRILPYRTSDNKIDGVVITFTDVTTLQNTLTKLEAGERQAAAIAELGHLALQVETLEELFDEAVKLVSTTLGTDYSKVLQVQDGSKRLLVRAGCGWSDKVVAGESTVPTGLNSQAGFTMQTAVPVIVENLKTDQRFKGPRLLRDHGVISGVSVVIGPRENPWGVFGTHSKKHRHFSADDANFVQSVANVIYEAILRQEKTDALRESELQLRLITDALPVLIAYVDKDVVYRFCNARYTEWFNVAAEEIIGRKLSDVIGKSAAKKIRPYVDKALAGERVSFDQQLRYRYGPVRDVHAEYVPHLLEDGEVAGFFAMIEDVTQRRVNEVMRSRLTAIVKYSNDAIVGKDLAGRVTFWNRAAELMHGYTSEEMLGEPITKVIPKQNHSEVEDVVEKLKHGETLEQYETVRLRRDGTEIPVSLTASPIFDASHELVGISTIVRDVSDRQEREEALRQSEERLQIAKRAANLGIHDYNVKEDSVEWDDRVRDLWGVDKDEPINYETFIAGVHPDDREATEAALNEALDPKGDGNYHAQYRVVRRGTGTVRWIDATGKVTFVNNEPVRLVGTVLDITEWRRTQEALTEANRRKDEFLATLGHELRNPLAALTTAIECLREGAAGQSPEDLYDLMSRQSHHMTSLLNDLLDIGRITRGDVALRPEHLSLKQRIEGAVELLQADINEKGHKVIIDVEPDDLQLVADPVRLEQILINLLGNAIVYTRQPGTITARARQVEGAVELEIEDTGEGLTREEIKRIFTIFYQSKKGSGGLGIGLSLVKSLVELHGGSIEAESPGAGEGSVMRLRFPASLTARDPRTTPPDEAGRNDLSDVKVLVVDDHEDSLAALKRLLSKRCTVSTASTGETGLERAARFKPDVVLLDLALPGKSGFEVAAQLRKLPGLEDMYIIAMTGFGDAETAKQVAASGFDAHLIKPVDFKQLLELIKQSVAEAK